MNELSKTSPLSPAVSHSACVPVTNVAALEMLLQKVGLQHPEFTVFFMEVIDDLPFHLRHCLPDHPSFSLTFPALNSSQKPFFTVLYQIVGVVKSSFSHFLPPIFLRPPYFFRVKMLEDNLLDDGDRVQLCAAQLPMLSFAVIAVLSFQLVD